MIVHVQSDEVTLDVHDLIRLKPELLTHVVSVVRWNHKGQERMVGLMRLANLLDVARDHIAARKAGVYPDLPTLLVHWSETIPLLSHTDTKVRLEPREGCGYGGCNAH